jgi:hypothetical protein
LFSAKDAELFALMDRKSRSLFDIVAQGDAETLQLLLLEGKEERNVATLAVSSP